MKIKKKLRIKKIQNSESSEHRKFGAKKVQS